MNARDAPSAGGLSFHAVRAIASVAEHGGVTGAARALHVSASSVTRAIQQAEAGLGVSLFDRGPRGMSPTPAGQALAFRASRALEELRVAADGLRVRGSARSAAALPRHVTDAMLAAFVARAAHNTEEAAAASLGITQSALHQALGRLEHLAKAPLFERTRVGARLNESGHWMLQQARVALDEVRIGLDELARWRGQGGTRVAIGSLPMAHDVLVSQAVARALGGGAQLQLTVKDGTYESLTQMLRVAEIDFIVGPLRGAAAAPDLQEEVLLVDRFVGVVRAGHPLARAGRPASLRRMAPYPWVAPLPGTPAEGVFQRIFEAAGVAPPRISLRAHSTAVVRSVLLEGDHIALASPLQVQAELKSGLLVQVCAPLPGSERAIGITQRRNALASTSCRLVMDVLRQVAASAATAV